MCILDRIFLLRPILFYPIWTFYLAGYWSGMRSGGGQSEFFHSLNPYGIMISLSCIMASVYILNQLQDIKTDQANHRRFLLSDGIISIKEATWEAGFLAFLGLIIGFWIRFQFGIYLFILFLLTGWLYNFSPFQWKNKPLMGLIINGIGGWIIYTLGWKTGGGLESIPLGSIAYALAGVSVFLNTTLPDMSGDEKTGKITFVIRYGIKKTACWALLLEAAAIILACMTREWLLFFPGAAVLPIFVIAAVKGTEKNVLRATKYSVMVLVGAVCVAFPWYALLVLFIFFFTKGYYRKRFDFNYPNFKSV
jgi:4-hydroxybenzoate polyprenyltransferase